MQGKKEKVMMNRRFYKDDVKRWQRKANEEAAGNLTVWITDKLNKAVPVVQQVVLNTAEILEEQAIGLARIEDKVDALTRALDEQIADTIENLSE